jgi:hypothetical protein
MATLTKQTIVRTGITPTFVAAAGAGDAVLPSQDTYIEVKNAGGSPITVTIATPGSAAPDLAIADVSVSVGATTGDKIIGPLPADLFADPTTGLAVITYSGVTSVTVAAFELAGR